MTGNLAISEAATRHLDLWADQTMRGELEVHQLPAPVAAFYYAGWAEGIAHAKQQAAELEHRLDIAYLQLVTPKDRVADYQRRLEQHFAEEADRFFAEPVIEGPAPLIERRAA